MSLCETRSKWAECIKCGWTGRISTCFTLNESACAHCGALGHYLRILRNAKGESIGDNGKPIDIRTGSPVRQVDMFWLFVI